jgi:hypothetical protein
MNNERDHTLTEETRKKMLKIFRWFLPTILILNISFIVLFAIYQDHNVFLNILINIIDFCIIAAVTFKLYRLDKKDKLLKLQDEQ